MDNFLNSSVNKNNYYDEGVMIWWWYRVTV